MAEYPDKSTLTDAELNAPGGMSTQQGGYMSGYNATTTPTSTTPTTTTTTGTGTTTPFDVTAFQQSQLDRAKSDLESMAASLASRETTSASGAVASDEAVVGEEQGAVDQIDLAEGADPSREPIELLDAEIARITSDLRGQEQAINRSYDTLERNTKGKQEGEVGQTSVGLANAGGYLGFSGSGQGVMLSLAKSHRDELLALEAQRQQAIADARKAASDRRFDLVKLKAADLRAIDDEIYARQQDYFDNKLALQQEERTERESIAAENRAKMQDARDTIEALLTSFGGLTKDELTPEYQAKLEELARVANIPAKQLYKKLEAEPAFQVAEEDKTALKNLMLDAMEAGAPADVLNQISSAKSLTDAAIIAQPYLKAQPKSGVTDKINYSGNSFYYDSQRDTIENNLRSSRTTDSGDVDGYWADPEVYEQTYQNWLAAELGVGDFEDEFPVQTFIAPEDVPNAPPLVKEMYQSYEKRKSSLLTTGKEDNEEDLNGNGIPDWIE